MNFLAYSARVHPARLAKGLTTLAAVGFLIISTGCAGGDDPVVEPPLVAAVDSSVSPVIPVYDSGSPGYVSPVVSYDAGTVLPVDAGKPAIDAGGQLTTDAGNSSTDAGSIQVDAATDAGGFVFPDLFPRNDAGPAPTTDGGSTGGRDVNGPCKDLGLICFDFIDMWINAECQTCNSGKGCEGCAIPFAY